MRISLIGATGGTGRAFIDEALGRGHSLTVVARRPDAVPKSHPSLTVRPGDGRDLKSLVAGFAGQHDVLVSVVGASSLLQARKVTDLYSAATANLVEAAVQLGIPRLVVVSSAGIEPQPNDAWFYRAILKPLFLQAMYDDMIRMETLIRASPLAWTIVRPPYLTKGKQTRAYRVSRTGPLPDDKSLSRADLAHFLCEVCEGSDWRHVAANISM